MTVMTSTAVTLNAAFLQEIKEDNARLGELRHTLREVFSRSRPVVSRHDVINLLDELRDQLATHFALEEAFGYFDDPVDAAPRLCEEAERLRAQHSVLFSQMVDLADRADELLRRFLSLNSFRRIAEEYAAFDDDFQAHEDRENELIMQAFNDDIGVGD